MNYAQVFRQLPVLCHMHVAYFLLSNFVHFVPSVSLRLWQHHFEAESLLVRSAIIFYFRLFIYSNFIVFFNVPSPSIEISTTSPSFKLYCGFWNHPTPAGVPVIIAVPAGSVLP